jgi:hypothetical protein
MAKKKPRKASTGRRRDPDARRLSSGRIAPKGGATTVAARSAPKPRELSRIERERERIGDLYTGVDFPPDVLLTRGFIDREMRDEALRFASLSWEIYGCPVERAPSLYGQVVSGPSPDDEKRQERAVDPELLMRRKEAELRAMMRALEGSREAFEAVKNVAQFLRMPSLVTNLRDKRPSRAIDYSQMAALTAGLRALVNRRRRIEAHREGPKLPAAEPAAIATAAWRAGRLTLMRRMAPDFAGPNALDERAAAELASYNEEVARHGEGY